MSGITPVLRLRRRLTGKTNRESSRGGRSRHAAVDELGRAVPGDRAPRAFGHVGGLAIYDPASAPKGELTIRDVCQRISERIHLLPPFTQKLVTIPLGLDLPYWIEDPEFDIDFHVRDIGLPPPGNYHQLAEQVARNHGSPA